MELTAVREIFAQPDAYIDKEVTVGGWIRSIRDSRTFGFIVLGCKAWYLSAVDIPWNRSYDGFCTLDIKSQKLIVGCGGTVWCICGILDSSGIGCDGLGIRCS